MTPSNVPAIVFAAGGTGGHIAPCLAIAELLRDRLGATPPCWVVCSQRAIDAQMLEPALLDGVIRGFTPIAARPFGLGPKRLASLIGRWGEAVRGARRIIRSVGGESGAGVVAVSTGGFVGPPAMHAARVQGCRRVLINLDAVPGRAGRALAAGVDLRLDAAPGAARASRAGWTAIGPIVRRVAQPLRPAGEARAALGLDPRRPTLLITGGSQGSRSVNDFVLAHADQHGETWRAGAWQALHLCGAGQEAALAQRYAQIGVSAVVIPFLARMGDAWSAADVHVGRAGAATVAEVWCARTPSLLMPYPYHKDQHQALNAAELVEEGIAVLAQDHVDAARNLREHGSALSAMMTSAADGRARPAAREPAGAAEALERIGKLGKLGEREGGLGPQNVRKQPGLHPNEY